MENSARICYVDAHSEYKRHCWTTKKCNYCMASPPNNAQLYTWMICMFVKGLWYQRGKKWRRNTVKIQSFFWGSRRASSSTKNQVSLCINKRQTPHHWHTVPPYYIHGWLRLVVASIKWLPLLLEAIHRCWRSGSAPGKSKGAHRDLQYRHQATKSTNYCMSMP